MRRAGAGVAGALVLALGVATGCGGEGHADPHEPAAPALERIGRFHEPVFLAEPPGGDGTLYVAERAGTVRTLSPEGDVAGRPVLDLSAAVSTEGEGGLLSLAFAPDYERSRRLYVAYASRRRALVVAECRATAQKPAFVGCTDLLSIPHPNPIHWGGLLTFGPDGELYLGTGEGGPVYPIPAAAQDPKSLLGKLLRIDVDGGEAEIVASGLRNPWRYSFDRETGDLWIGDVGDFTEEEIDHVKPREIEGANFGWPDLEGTAQTKSDVRAPGAIPPEITYTRTGHEDEERCAVTGGYVVRDPEVPALEGRYLYADFCVGRIFTYDPVAGRDQRPGETGFEVPQLSSFAEDEAGRIYVISLSGPIYRIVQ